jgi:hypothetical protein
MPVHLNQFTDVSQNLNSLPYNGFDIIEESVTVVLEIC